MLFLFKGFFTLAHSFFTLAHSFFTSYCPLFTVSSKAAAVEFSKLTFELDKTHPICRYELTISRDIVELNRQNTLSIPVDSFNPVVTLDVRSLKRSTLITRI